MRVYCMRVYTRRTCLGTLPVPGQIPQIVGLWPPYLILAVDRPAIVDCPLAGWPPPTKSWNKDSEPLSNSSRLTVFANGSLSFRSVTMKDSGLYECEAENVHGFTAPRSINVTVACE